MAGDGGSGKTTIALQLGVAGVTGTDWFGIVVTSCNVLYANAEDPSDEIHFRLEQITKTSTISGAELAKFTLIDLAGEPSTIAVPDKTGSIMPTALFDRIESVAREHKVGCIILDAVADFFGGNENERRDVRGFISLLRGLAMRLNAAVVVIAHPSVDGIKSGRGYSGSTHWNNAVRSRLRFGNPEEAPDGLPLDADMRVLELAKSNRARRGELVHLFWDNGRFIKVIPGIVQNQAVNAEADKVFLELLAKRNKQGRHVSPNRSRSYAPAEFAKDPRGKEVGKAHLEQAMN